MADEEIKQLRAYLRDPAHAIGPQNTEAQHRQVLVNIWQQALQLSHHKAGRAMEIAKEAVRSEKQPYETHKQYTDALNGIPSKALGDTEPYRGVDKAQHFFASASLAYTTAVGNAIDRRAGELSVTAADAAKAELMANAAGRAYEGLDWSKDLANRMANRIGLVERKDTGGYDKGDIHADDRGAEFGAQMAKLTFDREDDSGYTSTVLLREQLRGPDQTRESVAPPDAGVPMEDATAASGNEVARPAEAGLEVRKDAMAVPTSEEESAGMSITGERAVTSPDAQCLPQPKTETAEPKEDAGGDPVTTARERAEQTSLPAEHPEAPNGLQSRMPEGSAAAPGDAIRLQSVPDAVWQQQWKADPKENPGAWPGKFKDNTPMDSIAVMKDSHDATVGISFRANMATDSDGTAPDILGRTRLNEIKKEIKKEGGSGLNEKKVDHDALKQLTAEAKQDGKWVDIHRQTTTALQWGKPRESLNAETIPYISVPPEILKVGKSKVGDLVQIKDSNRTVYGVVGDVGPRFKAGEASMKTQEMLGRNPNPSGGLSDAKSNQRIEYNILSGSGAKYGLGSGGKGLTSDQIQEAGKKEFARFEERKEAGQNQTRDGRGPKDRSENQRGDAQAAKDAAREGKGDRPKQNAEQPKTRDKPRVAEPSDKGNDARRKESERPKKSNTGEAAHRM
jgi:hypothetical protein